MGAAFDDFTVTQHQDLVGPLNGAEPVRNHEARAPGHKPFQGLLDQLLRRRVHRGGGFIQDEQRRVLEQRPRDADALLFPDAQLHAAFTDPGIIAVGKFLDEVMAVGRLGCGDEFVFRRVEATVENVLPQRAVEEEGFLRDNRDLVAQLVQRDVADIVLVDRDLAGGALVEPGQEIDQGRLARAGGADQRDHLAGLRGQGNVLEDRALVVVAEFNAGVFHVADGLPILLGTGGAAAGFPLFGRVHDVEHAFPRGPGGLKHLVEPVKLGDRIVKEVQVEDEFHQ